MICPRCRRSFYFLESTAQESDAQCVKCGHRGKPAAPSYEGYHEALYLSKPYVRTPRTDPQMRWVLEKMAIRPNEVIVDLGCGVGDYTRAIHDLGAKVAGYDRDVASAQKKYPGLSFYELDFSRPVPLPGESVDKVISVYTIEHLWDWDFFLKECRRVLKPGGLAVFSTANRDFLLHDFHFDPTHLHEWPLDVFEKKMDPYFEKLHARKDCAMFKYYPFNFFFRHFLKPDLVFVGKKK